MSVDIAAELRSWCIDHHLPSGASECLLCEAAQTVELFREELYQLARLATGGWEGEASGRDRDVQLYVGRLAHRHRQDRMGARLRPLVTWPMVATRTDVAVADDQRRVMCGDRVLAGQWSGVVAARPRPGQRRRHQPAIDRRNEPMTTTPLTMAEYEEAGGGGDTICQCGYRKSQHGPNHPAPDSHNPSQCNNRRFAPSNSFNEAVLLHREHVEPTLFEGEGAA